MAHYECIRELQVSDLEALTLPKLLDDLSINEELRQEDLAGGGSRFRRASDFPGVIKLEELRHRLHTELHGTTPQTLILLEDEQAVLSAALVLALSIEEAGGETGLSTDQIRALIKRLHSRQ